MDSEPALAEAQDDDDRHISCSMSTVALKLVRGAGGDAAVAELLEQAASRREPAYLENLDNWISQDEASALLGAGVQVTGDPSFARRVGEEMVGQHAGKQVATLLRSLGSVEAVLQTVAQTTAKLSAATELEAIEVGPGRAVLRAEAREGFTRLPVNCDWTTGLLAGTPIIFGLPLARVQESECQARGDAQCLYTVTWDAEQAAAAADPQQRVTAMEAQLRRCPSGCTASTRSPATWSRPRTSRRCCDAWSSARPTPCAPPATSSQCAPTRTPSCRSTARASTTGTRTRSHARRSPAITR